MRNSFLRQASRIFTPEEAAEIVLIIVLYNYINFDLCILPVTIIGLFMNDPYSLVFSTSHKKQFTSLAVYEH